MKYLLPILLCVALLFTAALGLKCYECNYQLSDSSIGQRNEDCQNADSKYSSYCDDSKLYCLKISGFVDGKPAGLRECTDGSWPTLVGGEDACAPTSSIVNFNFRLQNKVVTLVNGTVCACNSNSCNGKEKLITNTWAFVLPAFLPVILPAFY